MMTSLSGLAQVKIAPAPKLMNVLFEMCRSAWMAITAASWFVSLPWKTHVLRFSRVWGMQIMQHTLDFMFLGIDLSVMLQDCMITLPECTNKMQSLCGFI